MFNVTDCGVDKLGPVPFTGPETTALLPVVRSIENKVLRVRSMTYAVLSEELVITENGLANIGPLLKTEGVSELD